MPVAGSYSNGERWVSPSDVIKMMPKVSLSKDHVPVISELPNTSITKVPSSASVRVAT